MTSSSTPSPSATPATTVADGTATTAALDHVAMGCTRGALPLATWYAEIVGFEPLNFHEFSEGKVLFPSVRLNPNTILDFFESDNTNSSSINAKDSSSSSARAPTPALSSSSHMCFAFSRSAFDALLHRLREADVDFSEQKQRWGARGNGTSVYASDPEGNSLEFRHYD